MQVTHIALRSNRYDLGTVVVDGHDIGNAVTDVVVTAGPGRLTSVTMQLLGVLDLTAPARIELPPQTVAALQALGWTPPPGGTPAPAAGGASASAGGTP